MVHFTKFSQINLFLFIFDSYRQLSGNIYGSHLTRFLRFYEQFNFIAHFTFLQFSNFPLVTELLV